MRELVLFVALVGACMEPATVGDRCAELGETMCAKSVECLSTDADQLDACIDDWSAECYAKDDAHDTAVVPRSDFDACVEALRDTHCMFLNGMLPGECGGVLR